MPTTTTPPGAIYDQAALFADQLARQQQDASDAMLQAWAKAYHRARMDYDTLLAKLDAARAEGRDVSLAWLYQQDRLRNAIATTKVQIAQYADAASEQVKAAEWAAVKAATKHAARLGRTAVDQVGINGGFTELNPAPLRHLVGFLSDGSPLDALFRSFADETATALRDALIIGISHGKGSAWMTRQIDTALDVPRWRAETIMRTETQRVYRAAARETYLANADVLEGWVWRAHLDSRTCPACVVMDGTLHPVEAHLDGHPRCRCAMVPRTKSWADVLGIETTAPDTRPPIRSGKAWLEGSAPAVQLAVLGRAKFRAWKAGDVSLDDMVARTQSPEWGTMRRERSLIEIEHGRNPNWSDSAPREKLAPAVFPDVDPLADLKPVREPTKAEQVYIDLLEQLRKATPRNEQTIAAIEKHLAALRAQLDAAEGPQAGIAALPLKPAGPPGQTQIAALRADVQATNPGHDSPDRNFRVNCVHVANAYELRRRGYAVTATPLPAHFKGRGRDARQALSWWKAAEGAEPRYFERRTPLQVEKEALSWPVGARGWVVVIWKGRGAGGHIFNVERTAEGVKYVEAQSGNPDLDIARYWRAARPGSVLLCRVDDLTPTDAVLEFVNERG